jgi:hypothetical protein
MSKETDVYPTLKKYDDIFMDAWKGVLEAWEKGEISPKYESDLRCYLFSECLRLMKERNCAKPYAISTEQTLTAKLRADLVLGRTYEGDFWLVAIEIKWVGVIDKVTKSEVEEDMRKLGNYFKNRKGVMCYFALIDESRQYREELSSEQFGMKICEEETRTINGREVDALLFLYTP